ncbi:MAG: hypothetical protein V1850_07035 [Candidatus Bathyarchaeota archaeon]
MKISYIKIYGPPFLKAIQALEKVAVDEPEVCIMDTQIVGIPIQNSVGFGDSSQVQTYFDSIGVELPLQRCSKIISKSGEKLGEYDFFFEWFTNPGQVEVNNLTKKIDDALAPLGCKYTITTK